MPIRASTCGILTDALLEILQPSAPAPAGAALFGYVSVVHAQKRLQSGTLSREEQAAALEQMIHQLARPNTPAAIRLQCAAFLSRYSDLVDPGRIAAILETCDSQDTRDHFIKARWLLRAGRFDEAEALLFRACDDPAEISPRLISFAWEGFRQDPVGMVQWLTAAKKKYGKAFRIGPLCGDQAMFFLLWLAEKNRLTVLRKTYDAWKESILADPLGSLRCALLSGLVNQDARQLESSLRLMRQTPSRSGSYVQDALGRYWLYLNFIFEDRVRSAGRIRMARWLAECFHRECRETNSISMLAAQNMVKCLAAVGDGATAVERLKALSAKQDGFNMLAVVAAQILWSCRDAEQARAALAMVKCGEQSPPDLLFRYALVQVLLGDTAAARTVLAQLYQKNPEYDPGQKAGPRLTAYLLKGMGHSARADELWAHSARHDAGTRQRSPVFARIVPAVPAVELPFFSADGRGVSNDWKK